MKDDELKNLKIYLIRRFIFTLLVVLAAEFAVVTLENRLFIPIFFHFHVFEVRGTVTDFPRLLWSMVKGLLFGTNKVELFTILASSASVLAVLFLMFLLTLPMLLGALIFSNTVSERINRLQQEKEEETRAYAARRNLMISNMAHDLKTPITSISGLSRALRDGLAEDEAVKQGYLDAIARKSEKMAELITLLFSYVKLDSEGYELKKKAVDLCELVARECAAVYTDAEERGIVIQAEIPDEPYMIEADPVQLGRVFSNLISNAVKYNEAGTTLGVAVHRYSGGAAVTIADTGAPLEGDTKELFEPFVRGDQARTSDGGSGLGLSIAKRIAELHGYTLALEQPCGSYTKGFVVRVS